jgi:hypothetical protein
MLLSSPRAEIEITALLEVDTKCTTPSLIPTVNGNTVRSFSTRGQQSAAKGSLFHALTSDSYNILTPRLLVWSGGGFLVGYFPIHLLPNTAGT